LNAAAAGCTKPEQSVLFRRRPVRPAGSASPAKPDAEPGGGWVCAASMFFNEVSAARTIWIPLRRGR